MVWEVHLQWPLRGPLFTFCLFSFRYIYGHPWRGRTCFLSNFLNKFTFDTTPPRAPILAHYTQVSQIKTKENHLLAFTLHMPPYLSTFNGNSWCWGKHHQSPGQHHPRKECEMSVWKGLCVYPTLMAFRQFLALLIFHRILGTMGRKEKEAQKEKMLSIFMFSTHPRNPTLSHQNLITECLFGCHMKLPQDTHLLPKWQKFHHFLEGPDLTLW